MTCQKCGGPTETRKLLVHDYEHCQRCDGATRSDEAALSDLNDAIDAVKKKFDELDYEPKGEMAEIDLSSFDIALSTYTGG